MAKKKCRPWLVLLTEVGILRTLLKEATYGNRIAEEIKKDTRQVLSPNPNLLYPLLRKMEEAGYISGAWDAPDKRNRRIYHITEFGKNALPELEEKAKAHFIAMEKNIAILRNCLFEGGKSE